MAAELGLPRPMVRVAVAQNKNDQAETVLLRVIRGTGADGLAAMPRLRRDRGGFDVVRPLLDVERGDVEAYCAEMGLEPRRDSTNLEPVYKRNKVRLELLPALAEGYNANIVGALARLAANAAEDRDFFAGLTDGLIGRHGAFGGAGGTFPLDVLAGLHPALRHRLIVKCFELAGLAQDIESSHLRAADAVILGGREGKAVDFPGGYRLEVRRPAAAFHKPPAAGGPGAGARRGPAPGGASGGEASLDEISRRGMDKIGFEIEGTMVYICCMGMAEWSAAAGGRAGRESLALDMDMLGRSAGAVAIRTRRAGDFIRPAGMDGRKKLQDLFVDAKIPRAQRDSIPLAAAGGEALWIMGGGRASRKTGNYAINEGTARVLLLEYEGHA
jgi:tRNA(Ile)-lysidine synthase